MLCVFMYVVVTRTILWAMLIYWYNVFLGMIFILLCGAKTLYAFNFVPTLKKGGFPIRPYLYFYETYYKLKN